MKRLLLLRHGPAGGKASGGNDRERPLTPDGRRAVEAMALRLRTAGASADLALCSTALRARETLDILFAEQPRPAVELEDALYLADSRSLLRRLRELPADARSVLVIGHNPGLQELATALAGQGGAAIAAGFPAAGAAVFDVQGAWSDLAPANCRLGAFYSP